MRAAWWALVCLLVGLPVLRALHTDPAHDADICEMCEGGDFYCPGQDAFVSCPAQSATAPLYPASNVDHCICNNGYERIEPGGSVFECHLGESPYYYMGGTRFICPNDAGTVADGQHEVTACQCNSGYTGTIESESSQCQACAWGKFKEITGPDACLACPTNSGVDEYASDSLQDCECNAGYRGIISLSEQVCHACEAGTYKPARGTAISCTDCVEGKFSTGAAIECTQCHEHASSPAGSVEQSACTCNAGYEEDEPFVCNPCDVGTGSCVACGSGEYAEHINTTSCDSCAVFTNVEASQGAVSCVCLPGYLHDNTAEKVSNYNAKLYLTRYTDISIPEREAKLYHSKFQFSYKHTPTLTAPSTTWYMDMNNLVTSSSPTIIENTDHYERILLNESFRVLDFSNWGMTQSATDAEYRVTINIWRAIEQTTNTRTDTPQTLTLVFSIAAGETRVSLVRVLSSAHETHPYDMPVLPRYIKLSKQHLAGHSSTFNDERQARQTTIANKIISGASIQDQARYTDFWEPYYSINAGGVLNGYFEANYANFENYFASSTESDSLYLTINTHFSREYMQTLTTIPPCQQCPTNTFAPGRIAGQGLSMGPSADNKIYEECRSCPFGSSSPAGSSSIRDCICDAGYTSMQPPFENACWPCESGKYKSVVGSAACDNCPANTQQVSPDGNTAASSCLCNAGYSGSINTGTQNCQECAPGTFKDAAGTSACANCAAGKYSDDFAATVCSDCPTNSNSPAGSDAISRCVCNAGYGETTDAGVKSCEQCAAGDFSANGEPCQNCPAGTISASAGASACVSCADIGPNTVRNEFRTACECDAGYFGLPESCQACASGTYKSSPGSTACQACGGSQTTVQGETVIEASRSENDCKCILGYYPNPDAGEGRSEPVCKQCASGTYRATYAAEVCTACDPHHRTPNEELPWDSATDCQACTACPAGGYEVTECSAAADTLCAACPTGSTTVSQVDHFGGINDCLCDLGFDSTVQTGVCIECEIGKYKSTIENTSCTVCPRGTTQATGKPYASACRCDVGTTYDGVSACVQCDAGKYKDFFGDRVCSDCSAPVEWSDPGATACVCNKGYTGTIGSCTNCAGGTYKDVLGSSPCVDCAPNSFTPVNANYGYRFCFLCFTDLNDDTQGVSTTLGLSGQTTCVCPAGYQFASSPRQCQACVPGATFKEELDEYPLRDECASCTPGCSTGERVLEACTEVSDLECTLCQSNSNSPSGFAGTICYCNAGYEPAATTVDGVKVYDQCVICAAGKYNNVNDQLHDESPDVMCADCSAGKFQNQQGQSSCQSCTPGCPTGNYITDPCDNANRITDIGCAECNKCDLAGEYQPHPCDGSGSTNPACETCPPGSYCPADSSVAEPCPYGAQSPAGATSLVECGCDPGQYVDNTTSCTTDCCVPCLADHHCVGGYAYECPPDSVTLPSDSPETLHDCSCAEGHLRQYTADQSTFACIPCLANHYCQEQDGLQIPCPEDTAVPPNWVMTSPAESVALSQCRCSLGYYNTPSNDGCLFCPADSYCSAGHRFLCTEQRPNSHTNGFDGQTNLADCICAPGYYERHTEDGTILCEQCPAGFYCDGTKTQTLYHSSADQCFPHSTTDTGTTPYDPLLHDDPTDCHCDSGYERICEGTSGTETNCDNPDATPIECRQCGPSSYCYDNKQYNCPANSVVPEGEDNHNADDCVCKPGYRRVNDPPEQLTTAGFSCQPCAEHEYCFEGNYNLCTDSSTLTRTCRDHEGNDLPETDCIGHELQLQYEASACVCKPKWFQVVTGADPSTVITCQECAPGSFCADYGNVGSGQPCAGYLEGTYNAYLERSFEDYTVIPSDYETGTHVVTSVPGAFEQAQCICQAGFHRFSFGGTQWLWCTESSCSTQYYSSYTCLPCARGSYCPGPDHGQQQVPCPSGEPEFGVSKRSGLITTGERKESIEDCVCSSKTYLHNNGESPQSYKVQSNSFCVNCPANAFCSNNILTWCTDRFNTPELRYLGFKDGVELLHTNGATRQSSESACKCIEGYFRDWNPDPDTTTAVQNRWPSDPADWLTTGCTPCPPGFYCRGDGRDRNPNRNGYGGLIHCVALNPGSTQQYSTSVEPRTSVDNCMCNAGWQFESTSVETFSSLICKSCEDPEIMGDTAWLELQQGGVYTHYKAVVGNDVPCQECRSDCNTGSTYESASCSTTQNRECSPCLQCDALPVEHYTSAPCTSLDNTVCSECSEPCDTSTHYENRACAGESDRECLLQETDLATCSSGQVLSYNGENIVNSCKPCSAPAQRHGSNLWTFVGPGTVFNDPDSCQIQCAPNTKYDATSNTCVTCETGNVLLRVPHVHTAAELAITPRPTVCQFTCVPGAVLAGDDCVVGSNALGQHEAFEHTLTVSNFNYDNDRIHFRVSHTWHSRVAVFIGRTRVGRQAACTPGSTFAACCTVLKGSDTDDSPPLTALVSQLGLAGLPDASNVCPTSALITRAADDYTSPPTGSFDFSVRDADLDGIATCSNDATSNSRVCTLHITLFDTVHMRGINRPVSITTNDAGVLDVGIAMRTEYLPLSVLDARVALLSEPDLDPQPAAEYVYELRLRLQATAAVEVPVGHTLAAAFASTGLTQRLVESTVPSCDRYARPWSADSAATQITLASGVAYDWITYWASPDPVPVLVFALRLETRDAQGARAAVLANAGVRRDTALLRPLCRAPRATLAYTTAALYVAPGLGRGVATRMRYSNSSRYTTVGTGPLDGTPAVTLPADAFAAGLLAQADANVLATARGRAARLLSFVVLPLNSESTTLSLRAALSVHITSARTYDADVATQLASAIAADEPLTRRITPLRFTPEFRIWCRALTDAAGPDCVAEQHLRATGGAYFEYATLDTDGACSHADQIAANNYIARVTGATAAFVAEIGFVAEICTFAHAHLQPAQRRFGLGFVALKHSTTARKMDENVERVGTKSYVWLDVAATIGAS